MYQKAQTENEQVKIECFEEKWEVCQKAENFHHLLHVYDILY